MTSQVYAPLFTPLIILLLIVIQTYMLIHDKLPQICRCYIFLLSQIVASTLLSFFFFPVFICFKIAFSSSSDLSRMVLSHALNVRENAPRGGVGAQFELWGRVGTGIYVVFLTKGKKKKDCSYTWMNHLVICLIQNFTYDLLKNIFLTKQTSSTTYVNSNIEAHKINEL